jgi:hypothetical protein
MLLAFDTCSFLRIQNIYQKLNLDIRPVLNDFRIVVTDELKKEYTNFRLDKFFKNDFIEIPLSESERNAKISKYLLESFDSADQDLAIIGLRDEVTIVTDDRDLFYQCTFLKIPTFQLWSYCIDLVKENLLTKNEFHKCWKLWEAEKRYPKTILKLMKKELALL